MRSSIKPKKAGLGRGPFDPRQCHARRDDGRFLANLREAVEGCLSVAVETPAENAGDQVIELAL